MIIVMLSDFIGVVLSKAKFHYSVEDKFFSLKQGIFARQERHMPYGVIQNILIRQDMFDKIFKLASLLVENAAQAGGVAVRQRWSPVRRQKGVELIGFNNNKVSIPGLTKQNAEALKMLILQTIKENSIKDNKSGL